MTSKPSYAELEQQVELLQSRVAELERANERSQDAARQAERLRHYVGSVTEGMFGELMVIERDFTISDVNEAFLKTYGVTREAVLGRKCYEVTHQQGGPCHVDEHPCPVHDVFSSKRPCSAEHLHRSTLGNELVVEIHALPVFGEGGEVERVIEIHNDITDQRRAEQEKLVREKLNAVLELAGAVCHELNQPMQIALVYSMRLLEEPTHADEARELLAAVVESVERMAEITKKLAHIVRYETKDYVRGARIIDIDKASDSEE